MLKIAEYISQSSLIRKNLLLKKFLKLLVKIASKVIYGKYKKIRIANKYSFLFDSCFAFKNYHNWGLGHNKGFAKLLDISKNKKVIFDIGAHIGLCTLPLSRLALNIVSFEASPTNFKYLKKHLKINSISNVKLAPFLVGKENIKKVDFYDVGEGSGIPSIVNLKNKKKYIETRNLKIKQISIIPDVLKIDVEGSEFNVLDGASQVLRKYRPDIIISLHPDHLRLLQRNINEIYDYCNLFSYKLLSVIDHHEIISDELCGDEYYMKPI